MFQQQQESAHGASDLPPPNIRMNQQNQQDKDDDSL
jgi:hypothetical protein